MVEDKYVFDEEDEEHEKTPGFIKKINDIGTYIWNSKTKEFCGRDGISWAKVSLFYGVFYTLLGGFFIGMLAVFMQIMPKDKPTYYGVSSIMNARSSPLNPGLGFRPQIDPEDHVIRYDPFVHRSPKVGSVKYIDNLKNFLNIKYKPQDRFSTIECQSNASVSYEGEFKNGKACKFDYQQLFKDTPCTEANSFNYGTPNPCILIKMNKIVSWQPQLTNSSYISVRCAGENAYDVDNIKKITYYSEGSLGNTQEGQLPAKYFPFWAHGQKSYLAPFVWAVFEVTPNALINVECKAYADNIDNKDRLNRRGQTKFTLFVESRANPNSNN